MRCINIDWLEVYCFESKAHLCDKEYFEKVGYVVKKRDYGTPQYKEVLTLYEYDKPFIEIRRLPYSLKRLGGIFEDNACHIRLANRACYQPNVIDVLRRFLISHDYTYRSITRIDICLDFIKFDNLMNPQNVIIKYMKGDYSKINQSNIAAHGKDAWDGRTWNSLKWGSPTSSISTKLYCKSLEMQEVKEKFHIEDAWTAAGIDWQNNKVWRVEFSVKTDIKGYVRLDDGEMLENKLTTYDTPERLMQVFRILAAHYFHFKIVERTRNGDIQRKDRCKDLPLFKLKFDDAIFKPVKLTSDTEPDRTDKLLVKRLELIVKDMSLDVSYRNAALELLKYYRVHKRIKRIADDTLIMSYYTKER